MDTIKKPEQFKAHVWLVKPILITEIIVIFFQLLYTARLNLKRRLKGFLAKTRTSNSGGQPIHRKLKIQPWDHFNTLFLNPKTQPPTLMLLP